MIKKLLCERTDILVIFWIFAGGAFIIFLASMTQNAFLQIFIALAFFLVPAIFNEWREKFCRQCTIKGELEPDVRDVRLNRAKDCASYLAYNKLPHSLDATLSAAELSPSASLSHIKTTGDDELGQVPVPFAGREGVSFETVSAPDFGETLSGEVVKVHIHEGVIIAKDAELITIEFDKCIMAVPSPFEGVVDKVYVKEGDRISKGIPICLIISKQSSQ